MTKAKKGKSEHLKPNQWISDWFGSWQSDLQQWRREIENEIFNPEFRSKPELEKRVASLSGTVYQGLIMTNVWLQVLFEIVTIAGAATEKMLEQLKKTRASKKEVAAIRDIARQYEDVFAKIRKMSNEMDESRKKALVYVTR
jgi:hypothetical protein